MFEYLKQRTILLAVLTASVLPFSAVPSALAEPADRTTVATESGIARSSLYQQAQEELPRDLYVLYRISDRLIRANNLAMPYWRIMLSNQYAPDAYAGAPYVITFDRGLLDLLEGDVSALAWVVAHEMAHHVHQHQKRSMELGRSAMEGAETPEDYAAYEQRMKEARHEFELEADKFAYLYAVGAGFDPEGGMRALKHISNLYGDEESFTHPAPSDRVAALETLMAERPPEALRPEGESWIALTDPLPYLLSEDEQSLRVDRRTRLSYEEEIDKMFPQ